jgi:citrate lyase subunit beta / citryl-CoA lyase
MLFVPGVDAKKLGKLEGIDVPAFVVDLEDAVAEERKAEARQLTATTLQRLAGGRPDGRGLLYVRVNGRATPHMLADLLAVVGPGLAGIVLPKVESAEEVRAVDWTVGQLERDHRLAPGSVALVATIESARGLREADAIAASTPRLECLGFGVGDLTTDLGVALDRAEPGPEALAFATAARIRLAVASRAAGIAPPHDGVFLAFRDDDGLARQVASARALGFGGMHAIHPRQVPIIEAGFAPDEAELAWARRVADAFDAAEADGTAAILVDGEFIDYALAARARRILATAP